MLTKVYSYPGIADGEIQIKVGNALIRVPFTGGHIDRKNARNATYTTSDPVMQQIIEGSHMFGRRIFLDRTYGTAEAKPSNTTVVKKVETPGIEEQSDIEDEIPSVMGKTEYPEVTTFDGAVAVLKANGVKAVSLRTKTAARRAAASLGIVFPNYSFDGE